MNYYPYYSYLPNSIPTSAPRTAGLFSRLFRNGINWGSIINNTQKTLNIINQAIPVVKQVSPVVRNAKTMFKVMNEFKKTDTSPTQNKSVVKTNNIEKKNSSESNQSAESTTSTINKSENGPTFFA